MGYSEKFHGRLLLETFTRLSIREEAGPAAFSLAVAEESSSREASLTLI